MMKMGWILGRALCKFPRTLTLGLSVARWGVWPVEGWIRVRPTCFSGASNRSHCCQLAFANKFQPPSSQDFSSQFESRGDGECSCRKIGIMGWLTHFCPLERQHRGVLWKVTAGLGLTSSAGWTSIAWGRRFRHYVCSTSTLVYKPVKQDQRSPTLRSIIKFEQLSSRKVWHTSVTHFAIKSIIWWHINAGRTTMK